MADQDFDLGSLGEGMANPPKEPIPQISGDDDFAKLSPGSQFIGPDGKQRKKLWEVKDDATFSAVPAGEQFLAPDGSTRWKEKIESPDFFTQTLYNMAKTPAERFNAMKRGYGADNVKQDPDGGYYADLGQGRRVKPSAGTDIGSVATRGAAGVAAMVAPTLGSIAGAAGGGAIGAPAGPAGVGAGAIAGGAAGMVGGERFNNGILKLAGVYDRSDEEQSAEDKSAAMWGAAGEAGGQIIGKVAHSAPSLVKDYVIDPLKEKTGIGSLADLSQVAGAAARHFTGFTAEHAAQIEGLDHVPASAFAPEAPMLSKMLNVAKIFGYDPVAKYAGEHYEKQAGKILTDLGVAPEDLGQLTKPIEAVSGEKAGTRLVANAQQDLAKSDADLAKAIDESHGAAIAKADTAGKEWEADWAARTANTLDKIDANQKVASGIIDDSWNHVRELHEQLLGTLKSGGDPTELANTVAQSIKDLRQGVSARAERYYTDAEKLGADAKFSVANTQKLASDFMDQLPEDLQRNHPALVKMLANLESGEMTFAEGHYLRSILRDLPNWQQLAPDFRTGIFKKLSGTLDADMHAAETSPEMQRAVGALDSADKFYRTEMARFKDERLQAFVSNTKAGLPPNPEVIAGDVLVSGRDAYVNEMKKIVSPEVWNQIIGADMSNMMKSSRTIAHDGTNYVVDSTKLVQNIEERIANGVFDHYPPEVKEQLLTHAKNLLAMDGKLEVTVGANEDLLSAVQKMTQAQEEMKVLAKERPIDFLQEAMAEHKENVKALQSANKADRDADQLSFLSQPNAKVEAATNKILSDPDLITQVFQRWGPESETHDPELISALRETAARKLLTRDVATTGKIRGELAETPYTPEVQKLLFPGDTKESLQSLAKNMELLVTSENDLQTSFVGGAMVIHPKSAFSMFGLGKAVTGVPAFVLRPIVGKVLSTFADHATSTLPQWMAKTLKEGGEAGARTVRAVIDADAAGKDIAPLLPSPVAASVLIGQTGLNAGSGAPAPKSDTPSPPKHNWRERNASATSGSPQPGGAPTDQMPPPAARGGWRERFGNTAGTSP